MGDAERACSGCHDAHKWKAENARLREELDLSKRACNAGMAGMKQARDEWKDRAERAEEELTTLNSQYDGLMLENAKLRAVVEAARYYLAALDNGVIHPDYMVSKTRLRDVLDALKGGE